MEQACSLFATNRNEVDLPCSIVTSSTASTPRKSGHIEVGGEDIGIHW